MIKRSIPATLSVRCETSDYAQGMKDGITHTLQCLLHECDVIVRISPYVEKLTEDKLDDDSPQQYRVRARFTVREKFPGKLEGEWIKTDHAFYEEEFDDGFDKDKVWVGLTDEEIESLKYELRRETIGVIEEKDFVNAISKLLKEKNGG